MTQGRQREFPESWPRRSALIALSIATLILIFWVVGYRSLVGGLGEWQFDRFGLYFPALTATAIFALLAIPLALLFWGRTRRQQRRELGDTADEATRERLALSNMRRTGVRFTRFFGLVAILLAGATIAGLVSLTMLPDASGVETRIDSPMTLVGEGVARFDGGRVGRIARLDEHFGLASRRTYVAPVTFARDDRGPVRFLTTVEQRDNRFYPVSSGILVQHGLPNELVGLYRSAGVTIDPAPYLMMRDEAQVRWRTRALVIQLAIEALLATLAWALLRRQGRRVAEATAAPPAAAAAPAA